MYNINDFVFYIPMKGNATDYSRNGYSTTVSGATLTTNSEGISNMAYNFDGTNDEITMGAAVYDAFVDAINAGSVTVYANMINNATANNNDCVISVIDASPDFEKAYLLGELTGSSNYHYTLIGGGASNSNNIWSSATPVTGTWKRKIWETTFATTKYTGRILKDGVALSLSRTETNQVIVKSTQGSREISIGWRADSPANRSFKGKMNNVFAIKRVLTSADYKFISKFSNTKRVA